MNDICISGLETRIINGKEVAVVTQNNLLSAKIRLHEKEVLNEVGDPEPSFELSVYSEPPASKDRLRELTKAVIANYPSFTENKRLTLASVLYENCFNEQRFKDAFMYILANFKYKEPTIADFASFDKCIRLYTYTQCVRMINRGEAKFQNEGGELIPYFSENERRECGYQLWYKDSDLVKYGLKKRY